MIGVYVVSLIYVFLITIIYLSKKKIKNKDNMIYNRILLINIFGVIIDMLQYLAILNNYSHSIVIVLNKIFLIYINIWTFSLAYYVYCVASEDDEKKIYDYIKYILVVNLFLFCILSCLLPIDYYFDGVSKMYSHGLATTFSYFSGGFYMFIMLFCIFIDYKFHGKKLKKKYIPLFAFTVLGTAFSIIQLINPAFIIMSPLQSFITVLMYFFIENPDVKMIAQLEVAKDLAEKANAAKTDFLSSMSHEIRTPLNAIVGFSDCIQTSETLEEAQENARDIINASTTLLEIVNGILDISKIEAGKLEIVNSPYKAKETFEELAKLITPRMREKGLDFSYYIAPDIPNTLYGDHANIKKIVTNLLSNACKYTAKGYVRYEVNCVNSEKATRLIISVEDTGQGVKKENIDKLFTKFQRLEEDRNATIEGTGLGLAITKQLTELMGGRIIVHTVWGEGSKFTIVINQRIEKDAVEEPKNEKQTLDLSNVRILLVDDNELNLKVGVKVLEKYKANFITCAKSGMECIERIKLHEKYDIILLDDLMPKMRGKETLDELNKIPGFNLPVVALTANAITGMREKYLNEGFDDYLSKPMEKEQLVKVLNRIIDCYKIRENSKTKKEDVVEENADKETKFVEEKLNNFTPPEIPIENPIEEVPVRDVPIVPKEKIDDIEELQFTEEIPIISEENSEPIIQESTPVNLEIEEPPAIDNKQFLIDNGADIDKALELLGDMDMYNDTIKDFLEEVEEKWQNIETYKLEHNMDSYAIEVHSLKSDARYLGFMKLGDLAYNHELASKENNVEFVDSHFNELSEEYERVLNVIKKYVEMI